MEQFSPSGYTLSQVVNQFYIASFDDKRTYYKNFLYLSKMVWRELFWESIYAVNRSELKFEQDEYGTFIRKPRNMARLLTVMVHDGCAWQPLIKSGAAPFDFVPAPQIEECKCTGSELCNIVKSSITTRVETYNNVDYTLKTYFDTLACGEVYEVTEFPVYDSESGEVLIEKKRVLSCTLDVGSCGCPKPTPENKAKIVETCGCLPIYKNCELPLLRNKNGYYNMDERGGKIYFTPDNSLEPLPTKAMLIWQTNISDSSGGSISDDCIVPEYALKTMFTGLVHFSTAWRRGPQFPPQYRISDLSMWEAQKMELIMFLNPFDPVAFRAIQGIVPKWG